MIAKYDLRKLIFSQKRHTCFRKAKFFLEECPTLVTPLVSHANYPGKIWYIFEYNLKLPIRVIYKILHV